MSKVPVCAVVVTFNPGAEFPARISSIEAQVDSILVIDNASGSRGQAILNQLKPSKEFSIIRNARNLGIGAALNAGMAGARTLGFQWALALDQDSVPEPNMVAELSKAMRAQAEIETLAIIAPQTIDSVSRRPAAFLRPRFGPFYRRSICVGHTMEVTSAISSGSLVNLKVHEKLGGLREDYFMDYVDIEYCLRAQMNGFRVLAACGARLNHQLGKRSEVKLGPFRLFPTHHPPSRWYTISRNRIAAWQVYALRFPHWLSYEIVASAFITSRMLFAEHGRRQKVGAILAGIHDGLRGQMGQPPEHIEARDNRVR